MQEPHLSEICIFYTLLFGDQVFHVLHALTMLPTPAYLVDQNNDPAAQFGRVMKLVLRLVEDQPEQAFLLPKFSRKRR